MALLLFAFGQTNGQAPVSSYTIKNGKMYIAVGKDIQKISLDSFVAKYELPDLDLQTCISTGLNDTLTKLGWKIDIDNKELFVISKPLFSADNVNNVADRIIFTQKGTEPVPMAQVHFGYNRFKNKAPFAVVDSTVSFFLRGNTNAGKVMLAGTFTDCTAMPVLPVRKTNTLAAVQIGGDRAKRSLQGLEWPLRDGVVDELLQ